MPTNEKPAPTKIGINGADPALSAAPAAGGKVNDVPPVGKAKPTAVTVAVAKRTAFCAIALTPIAPVKTRKALIAS